MPHSRCKYFPKFVPRCRLLVSYRQTLRQNAGYPPFFFACCALPREIRFFALQEEICTTLNAIESTFLGPPFGMWWSGVEEAVITVVGGSATYAIAMVLRKGNDISGKFVTRIWKGCDGRTSIAPWVADVIFWVLMNISGSTGLVTEVAVVTKTQFLLYNLSTVCCAIRIRWELVSSSLGNLPRNTTAFDVL